MSQEKGNIANLGNNESVSQAVSKSISAKKSHSGQSSPIVAREPLHKTEDVKNWLKDVVPKEFKLGSAISNGDGFFDAIAQGLNQRTGKQEYDVKSIRLLCDEYAKNPNNKWVEEANRKDREDHNSYLVRIQFTAQEMEEKEEQGLKLGIAIWGRPKIEGKIICEKIGIKLHIIEIQEDGSVNGFLVDDQGEKEEINPNINYSDKEIIHLVNYHNHYVPLISANMLKKEEKPSSTQLNEHSQNNSNLTDTAIWNKLCMLTHSSADYQITNCLVEVLCSYRCERGGMLNYISKARYSQLLKILNKIDEVRSEKNKQISEQLVTLVNGIIDEIKNENKNKPSVLMCNLARFCSEMLKTKTNDLNSALATIAKMEEEINSLTKHSQDMFNDYKNFMVEAKIDAQLRQEEFKKSQALLDHSQNQCADLQIIIDRLKSSPPSPSNTT